MVKEDFKKGQEVFILKTGNAARGVQENKLIEKWIVTSVGKKFVSAAHVSQNGIKGTNIKFDIERNFIQKTDYCIDYVLFLSEEDAKKEIWKENVKRKILNGITWRTIEDLSNEDLKTIERIIDKTYENLIDNQ